MIWYGMVWCGMIWYDMVWYGMMWYGKVSLHEKETLARFPRTLRA